jgi:DNA-binding transcriptional MerR regulator
MLTIAKIAKRAGVNPSVIRYYERQDLIRASRLSNGYRVYDEDSIRVSHFLREAQTLGITLKEVKQLLELTRDGQRSGAVGRRQARQFSLLLGGRLHFCAFHHHTGRPLSAQDPPASAAGSSLEGPISQSILSGLHRKKLTHYRNELSISERKWTHR